MHSRIDSTIGISIDAWAVSVLNTGSKFGGHSMIVVEGLVLQDGVPKLFVGQYDILAGERPAPLLPVAENNAAAGAGAGAGSSSSSHTTTSASSTHSAGSSGSTSSSSTASITSPFSSTTASSKSSTAHTTTSGSGGAFSSSTPFSSASTGGAGDQVITIVRCFEGNEYGRDYSGFSARTYAEIPRVHVENMIASIKADQRQTEQALRGNAEFIPYQMLGSDSLLSDGSDGINCAQWVKQKLDVAHINHGNRKSKPKKLAPDSTCIIC
jgi:hypothetical protein